MTQLASHYEREQIGPRRHRMTIHARPIAFQRAGAWQRITNTLAVSGDAALPIGCDELVQFRVRDRLAGNSPVLHFGHGASHIRLTPLGTANVTGIVDGNRITFPSAWNGADLSLSLGGHIVRKDIALRSGHPRQFSFRIDGHAGFDTATLSAATFRVFQPTLEKGPDIRALTWAVSSQGGKTVLTATLPEGDWAGWTLDPTLTLQPDGTGGLDTYIGSTYYPTQNFGAATVLYTGEEINYDSTYRSLLKFDLSSLAGYSVISATLSLNHAAAYSSNARAIQVYRQKRAWVESQATWNIYSTGTSWQAAGGFGSDDCEQTGIGSTTVPSAASGQYDWSLTPSAVQAWVNGTFANNGMLLKADTETDDCHGWRSSDYATASERPKLVIEYTEAATTNRRRRVMVACGGF